MLKIIFYQKNCNKLYNDFPSYKDPILQSYDNPLSIKGFKVIGLNLGP